jgi:hypothetical protein
MPRDIAQNYGAHVAVGAMFPWRSGVLGAMKWGAIRGVNIAPNTVSDCDRGGQARDFEHADRMIDIAPNTLP